MPDAAADLQPKPAPQEAPKETTPEAPQTPPAEHWTKKPFEGGSLGAAEKAAEMRGMGKEMEQKAEAEAEKFGEETKSMWGRVKERLFKKKETPPVKGESEILAEIEKADATFREFRKEMARIMAHGGEEDLRVLESNLSAAYEQLAPQVAAEGADESKAMMKALKTGEMPQVTETGAKLNYVAKRLADVRAKLAGGATGSAEALAAANAAYQEQAAAEPPPAAPAAPEQANAPLSAEAAAAREFLLKGGKLKDGSIVKGAEGLPGAAMVDEYLKVRDLKSDKYGNIAARAFDPVKGEIRLTYEDGSQLRRYANGTVLRVTPGGKAEEVKPEAQIVEEAGPEAEDAEAGEAAPEPDEEIFDEAEKAQLVAEGDKARRIAEMGQRVDAAMSAEDEAAAMEAVGSLEKGAAAETMAERQRQWDADKAEHERQRNEKLAALEAAAAGKAMVTKTSEDALTASGEIENKTVLQRSKSSAESPTASGEIDTEPAPPAEAVVTEMEEPAVPESVEEAPPAALQPDAEMEFVPAPHEEPPQPAAEAAPAPEKKESAFGKLDAKLDEAAAEIMKMPEATESPKTFPTKVGKLPADKFLEAFKAVGAVTEAEAKDLAEQFKLESEEFDAMRKKLSQAVRKRMKG